MTSRTIVIFLGPPGAGKGSQAKLLSKASLRPVLLIGDALRKISKQDTLIGRKVRKALSSGELMDNRIIAEVICERSQDTDFSNGFIIDGYPRNLIQAEWLDRWATQQEIRVVPVYLTIPKEIVVRRTLERRSCAFCGEVFNTLTVRPKVSGFCDFCGNELRLRADDMTETIERRYRTFESETLPLLEHYEREGRLICLDGQQPIESLFHSLAVALDVIAPEN